MRAKWKPDSIRRTVKISIIIPSYNQGPFLRATLDSILAQQHPGVEVIVKDGGSSDNSVEVLRSFGDRIRWHSARDRGQTDAINRGLMEAQGEIVAYLNSDDVYFPGSLAAVEDHFSAHPDCQILYGDAHHLHADGSFMEVYPTEGWDRSRLLQTCFICQPAAFWRRRLHDQVGYFDESLHFSMDYDFWLRCGARFPLFHLGGKVLAGSRLHQDTKTLRQRVPCHREILRVIQRHASHPSQTYGWLKHLASLQAREDGFPPSSDARTHAAHVQAFARHTLLIAQGYRIELLDPVLEELEGLLAHGSVRT